MAKQTYYEMLKDPRWQKKRLEIMERDKYTCRECGATTKTLHVHHRHYEKDKAPWEYPNKALKTLCEDCHEYVTGITNSIKKALGRLSAKELDVVLGFVAGIMRGGVHRESLEPASNELRLRHGTVAAIMSNHGPIAEQVIDAAERLLAHDHERGSVTIDSEAVCRVIYTSEGMPIA